MYVPPECMFNKDFLQSLLNGEKKMFNMDEIKPKNVPKYDELSVKNIFPHLKDDPEVMAYFPNQMA